jgi:demethylmenaquinone methyltransferase/2-methoxy-6-polyprenyl-1,4-benzoquinol methylase
MGIYEPSRVTRSKLSARQSYNRMSRWYDLIAGTSERKYTYIGITQLNPQPGEFILEIGCGTGHGLLSLARSVTPSGRIFGLDISEGMLTRASSLISKNKVHYPIYLQLGDGSYLPYSSNKFSAIFFSFTMELFDTPDIPIVLEECKRILAPGGRVGIVCLSKQKTLPVRIYEWFHKKLPTLIDCRPISIQPHLLQANYLITNGKNEKMWGLPVEIVTAVIAPPTRRDE